MRNLLNFLLKYNNLIVFLILEGVALYMLANGNSYHNSRLVKGFQGITNGINERMTNTRTYLNLREINSELAAENSELRGRIRELSVERDADFVKVNDTINKQQYKYIPAKVVNNSVNKQKNLFTIDKGTRQGISTNMAVTWNNNVAGVIVGCSDNYSVAISLLNLDFKLSARIKSNGYFGSLTWDGKNYRHALLNDIPQHITISLGDTVETTSYSAIFPEGLSIGTISDFSRSGSDFYNIKVELFTDFKKVYYIDVIGNLKRTEQTELENQFQ
jgi:rod shape-determining protein MreC